MIFNNSRLDFFSIVNIPELEENDPCSEAEKEIAASQVISIDL